MTNSTKKEFASRLEEKKNMALFLRKMRCLEVKNSQTVVVNKKDCFCFCIYLWN